MSVEDEGLPLADALRAYGDPQLWAAYESARTALKRIPDRPPWLHSSREARDEWLNRYEGAAPTARAALDTARQALELDFTTRVQRRELVATGIKLPISEQSERMVIPAHLWPVFLLSFGRSKAEAEGIEFVDVRVRRADARGAAHEFLRVAPPIASAPAVQLEPRRGRPNIKPILAAEMRRRAERGELRGKITQECRALRAWAEQHVQGEHIPQVNSIRRALSKLYQSLKEEINKEK